MHCWVPKVHTQSKPNLLLVHGFGANAMWQYADVLHHFMPKYNVSNDILVWIVSFPTFSYNNVNRKIDMNNTNFH